MQVCGCFFERFLGGGALLISFM